MERGHGGGRRAAEDRRRDYKHDHKALPSIVSETSSKRAKVADSNDGSDLFPETDNKSTTLTNQKNKAPTRSSPSGRQKRSNE